MLVVISNPTVVAGEAAIINALFDEGMEILHLRRHGITADEMNTMMKKIKPQYHHQVALHQHHDLAGDFGTKRLHFTEARRKEMDEETLMKLKVSSHILSTSFHHVEEYDRLPPCFSYAFFGPLFNSISKPGYTSTIAAGFIFPVQSKHPEVIAIGGIDATNIQQASRMKFNGAAVAGAIWHRPEESICQFKALQKVWKQTGR